ncbi:MAG: hypothetical protein ACHQT7_02675 [Candidatus Levyibacteriota bacterium]
MGERLVDVTFKGQIPEDAIERILAEHPGLSLVHEHPLPVRDEITLWQEELAQLRTMVARSRELLEAKDPEIVDAYAAYHKLLCGKNARSSRLKMPDQETFIAGLFQLMDASIDGYYEKFPECGLTEKGAYRKLDYKLPNPRQIRFIMFGHRLAEEKMTREELRLQEHYKGGNSVVDAIEKADNLVFWHLAGGYENIPTAKPRPLRVR